MLQQNPLTLEIPRRTCRVGRVAPCSAVLVQNVHDFSQNNLLNAGNVQGVEDCSVQSTTYCRDDASKRKHNMSWCLPHDEQNTST